MTARTPHWLLAVTVVLAIGAVASYPARERSYAAVTTWAGDAGPRSTIGVVAGQGMWALVALTGAVATWSLVRSRRQFWTLASAGVGVVAAYGLSEGLKVLVAQPRPCTGTTVATVATCPGIGDWSWPSNHSVLAAAFATACLLTAARTGWVGIPLALTIAASRVAAGVHHVHDVLSGLALGTLVVTGLVLALRPVIVTHPPSSVTARPRVEVGR